MEECTLGAENKNKNIDGHVNKHINNIINHNTLQVHLRTIHSTHLKKTNIFFIYIHI